MRHHTHSEPQAAPARHVPAHRREGHHAEHHDHTAMVEDFRCRFWFSLVLSVPMLALSPMIQDWLGLEERLAFLQSVCAVALFRSDDHPLAQTATDDRSGEGPAPGIHRTALAPLSRCLMQPC
jgi:hypothetical protein